MLRPIIRTIATLAVAAAGTAVSITATPGTAVACGSVIDIGYTVFVNNTIKGSGSYTAESCRAIDWVRLTLFSDTGPVYSSTITRYPSEPSSASFSPRDHQCAVQGVIHRWWTHESWQWTGGGGGSRDSNVISVNCT